MDWPTTFKMQLDQTRDLAQFTQSNGESFLHGKYVESNYFAVFSDIGLTQPCFTTQKAEKHGALVNVEVYADDQPIGSVRLMKRSWRLASTWKLFNATNQEMATLQQDVGLIEFLLRTAINSTARHYRVLNPMGQAQGQVQQIWVRAHVPALHFNCAETLRTLGDMRLTYAAALLIARYDVETVTFF